MEKRMVKLLVLLAILYEKVHYSDGYPRRPMDYAWLIIDCGAQRTNEQMPRSDEEFIKTGENKLISMSKIPDAMNTLRFFPFNDKNCYHLPLLKAKYLIRAGFYYGNYDGLSKPPTFDLEINGKFWATVYTSLSEEPVYYEIIYPSKETTLSVCLVRTQKDEIPFISSLEATNMPGDFYRLMDNNTALSLQNRTNFGSQDEIGEPLIYDALEDYNRCWKPRGIPGYRNVSSDNRIPYGNSLAENQPPNQVVEFAIQSRNPFDSISFRIDFNVPTQLSSYFVFYFKELNGFSNTRVKRKMQIYIDGHEKEIIEVPQNRTCQVVSLYPVTVVGPATVTISPTEDSTLPAILNAMEVFTAIDVSKGEQAHVTLLYFSVSFMFLAWFCQM